MRSAVDHRALDWGLEHGVWKSDVLYCDHKTETSFTLY